MKKKTTKERTVFTDLHAHAHAPIHKYTHFSH